MHHASPQQPAPSAPPAPLDPLALIEDLLNPAIDLPTMARARRLTLAQLSEAIAHPAVQAELEALRQLADARAAIIAIPARSTALATLSEACTNPGPTATDRASAIRAAHTLLKHAPPSPPARQRATIAERNNTPRPHQSQSHHRPRALSPNASPSTTKRVSRASRAHAMPKRRQPPSSQTHTPMPKTPTPPRPPPHPRRTGWPRPQSTLRECHRHQSADLSASL